MTSAASRNAADWATASGDTWAERWRDTDRALEDLSSHLLAALTAVAPSGPVRAFDVGCGAGSTSIALANAVPAASITACDLSPALARIAEERTARMPQIRVSLGDARNVAGSEGPFDLIFSRHGVMFFDDPFGAFRILRSAANEGGHLVFSCFQDWSANPWASDLASAAAGKALPPPGREPSGFAFADPDYVLDILSSSGWTSADRNPVNFDYLAGSTTEALSFLSAIGPASAIIRSLPEEQRPEALGRMSDVIDRHFDGSTVVFPAAAWIWSARAGAA